VTWSRFTMTGRSARRTWIVSTIIGVAQMITLCAQDPPASRSGRAADPRPVTFNTDIAPIVLKNCATCHRPGGGAPFTLLTYDDVRRRAQQVALVTRTRYMPPWKPDPNHGEFSGVRRLSDQELDLIQQWVEQGIPQGEPNDLPPAPRWSGDWQLGSPDLIVTMPEPYVLRSEGSDVFRTVVIPIQLSTPRYVNALEFHSNSHAVHHANIKIDRTGSSRRLDTDEPGPGFDGGGGRDAKFPDGHFLGWTPGQVPRRSEGTAWRLDPGSDLVIELHMMPTGKAEPVQVTVGLFFTSDPPTHVPYILRLGSQRIDIPAGKKDYTTTDTYTLPVDLDVVSVQPHAHYLARQIRGFAILPDGTRKWLIDISDWDFNWQDVYHYARPLALPRGATLVMQYTYDNSAANVRNPNTPPRRVTFGQKSSSEMGDLWLQVVTGSDADREVLDRDYAPKMLQEDIAGDEKALELDPGNWRLHADLASCYLDGGRVGEALAHLADAVRIEPNSASLHYDLGTALLKQKRVDEAAEHLDRAVRLKADFPEALNNLGAVRYLQGWLDDAIRLYTRSLALNDDNAAAHYNLGRALAAQHQLKASTLEYRRALEIDPDDAETHISLASTLAMQGEIGEAVAHYRRALQVKPDLPAALVDLAWILATSERPEIRGPLEAVALAERAAQLTKHQDPNALDTLAAAYFEAGRVDLAIRTAETALGLAASGGPEDLRNQIRQRLAFYKHTVPLRNDRDF
jgi:Flp pilus assembly protein TadD/mono/diheme cytochrome c family protein